MRPPVNGENKSDVSQSHLQNGGNNERLSANKSQDNSIHESSGTWDEQRTRIDGLLSTLKKEMQEVKSMDKNLTRQFIHLGGKIQELKEVEKKLLEEIDMEDNETDDLLIGSNNDTSVTVLEDTKL